MYHCTPDVVQREGSKKTPPKKMEFSRVHPTQCLTAVRVTMNDHRSRRFRIFFRLRLWPMEKQPKEVLKCPLNGRFGVWIVQIFQLLEKNKLFLQTWCKLRCIFLSFPLECSFWHPTPCPEVTVIVIEETFWGPKSSSAQQANLEKFWWQNMLH